MMRVVLFEDLLEEKGYVKKSDLDAVKRLQDNTDQSIQDILIKHSLITSEQIVDTYESMGYTKVNLEKERIENAIFEEYTVDIGMLLENGLMPISVSGEKLSIATMDPLNFYIFDKLKGIYGVKQVEVYIAEREKIEQYIKEKFPVYVEDETDIDSELDEIDDEELLDDVNVSDSPLVKRIDFIISEAIRLGASDIHIEAQYKADTKVRIRIDGDLIEFATIPKMWKNHAIARVKILAKMDISKKREPQDGEFAFAYRGGNFNLRVNTVPTIYGEKVVLRVLGSKGDIVAIEKLNFLKHYESVKDKISKKQGIIVVTGPTGSGKTTTLASILDEKNKPDVNIMTIENPAEIRIPGINQVEVTKNMGFAKILRAFLRQDPDIIMVGEVRDKESAEIAIQASLTGHLLLTTMHTNSAIGVVTRLVDMGVEPYLVADALELVISQRLIKRSCPHCQEEDTEGLRIAKKMYPDTFYGIEKIYKNTGCEKCNNIGYYGRIPVFEILALDDELRRYVAKADVEGLKALNRVEPIIYDGLEKVKLGLTTFKEVQENLYFM